MTDLANPHLAPWANFYVIVGSSGAALIGIHNGWDTVTHIVVTSAPGDATKKE